MVCDLPDFLNVYLTSSRMAVLNLSIVIFLSLKHTPLALLSVSNYDKLMPLHKIAGYTTIVAAWAHGICFLKIKADEGELHAVVTEDILIYGMSGLIVFFAIGITTLPWFMNRGYECKLTCSLRTVFNPADVNTTSVPRCSLHSYRRDPHNHWPSSPRVQHQGPETHRRGCCDDIP